MQSEAAFLSEPILTQLKAQGYVVTDASAHLDCAVVVRKFQDAIDQCQIHYPRTSLDDLPMLQSSDLRADLEAFHQALNNADHRITPELYAEGESKWRHTVTHVSVREPLQQIPEILPFILSAEIDELSSAYLGGRARIGYVKLKKSYANDRAIRTYNHVFHKDDNEGKILKTLTYLKAVPPKTGGGFNYVATSKDRPVPPDKIYFSDAEIRADFPSDAVIEFSGPAGTSVIADTLGIHKEGLATSDDRWIMIVNYVLNEEYGGTRPRQIMSRQSYDALDDRQRAMCTFIDVRA